MTRSTIGVSATLWIALAAGTLAAGTGDALAGGGGSKTGPAPAPPPKYASPPKYAGPPKAAPPPKFAPPPTPAKAPGAGTPAKQFAESPALAGKHVERPFGSTGEGRPFAPTGEGRPFGSVGEGRPFGSTGEGRPFGSIGEGRPFGTIGAPTPTGPLTVPAPDAPAPTPGPSLPIPRRLVPNPYVVLPPPSSLTVEPPPEPVAAPPAPVPPPSEPLAPAPSPPPSLAPTDAEIRLATTLAERGRDQLAGGQPYLAEVTLVGAVRLFPDDPVLRLDHAFALLGAGYAHAAAAELLRGLTLDPDLVDRTLNVVAPYGSQERARDAVDVAERYRTAFPLDSHGRFLCGFLALHLGDLERAKAEFEALDRADPEFPFARTFRARTRNAAVASPPSPPAPPESPETVDADGAPDADGAAPRDR